MNHSLAVSIPTTTLISTDDGLLTFGGLSRTGGGSAEKKKNLIKTKKEKKVEIEKNWKLKNKENAVFKKRHLRKQ